MTTIVSGGGQLPRQTDERTGAFPVETGALDDGRHLVRQYLAAALGWLATVALIVYLAVGATEPAVRVTLFLATVTVMIALLGVVVAVEVLRVRLMAERARSLPPPEVEQELDALDRRVVVSLPEPQAELTITAQDGVRRYEATGS